MVNNRATATNMAKGVCLYIKILKQVQDDGDFGIS